MQCRSCGAETPAESVYCPRCGVRLDEASEAEKVAQPAPAAALLGRNRQPAGDAGSTGEPEERERQLWQGGYSGKAMVGSWLFAGVLTLVLFVAAVWLNNRYAWLGLLVVLVLVWGVLLCKLAARKLGVHYELTTQRFIHHTGVLTRVTDRIEVIDIDDVTFEQGFVERMLGVGSIRISSSDRTHPELTLLGIDDVQRVSELIDDVRREERRRRGLHIEAI